MEQINLRKAAFGCSKLNTFNSLKTLLSKNVIEYRSGMIVRRSSELRLSHMQVDELIRAAADCFCDCTGMTGTNWMSANSLKIKAGLHNINSNEEKLN